MTETHEILIKISPIGVIHSSLKEAEGSPIQPVYAKGSEGIVEVYESYRQALKDLEGFERIWLLYWFHKAAESKLSVIPYMDTVERGLFATRAPCRPNPVGISPVKLLRIEDGRIYIAQVDILDGSPLLDIKPYVSRFDIFKVERNGWQDHVSGVPGVADKRFHNENKPGD